MMEQLPIRLFYSEHLVHYLNGVSDELQEFLRRGFHRFWHDRFTYRVYRYKNKLCPFPALLSHELGRGFRALFSLTQIDQERWVFIWGLSIEQVFIFPRNLVFTALMGQMRKQHLPHFSLRSDDPHLLCGDVSVADGFVPPLWYEVIPPEDPEVFSDRPEFLRPLNVERVANDNLRCLREALAFVEDLGARPMAPGGKAPGRYPLLVQEMPADQVLAAVSCWDGRRAVVCFPENRELLTDALPGFEVLSFPLPPSTGHYDSMILWHCGKASPRMLLQCLSLVTHDLLVVEEASCTTWNHFLLDQILWRTDRCELIARHGQALKTREDWGSLVDQLKQFKHFRMAAFIEGQVGTRREMWRILGLQYEVEKRWHDAATLYELAEDWEAAAWAYEAAGSLYLALRIWQHLRKNDRQLPLLIGLERWQEAAELCLLQGKIVQAAELLVKANQPLRAAQLYATQLDQPEKAARCYEAAQHWHKAAELHEGLGNLEKAARLYIEAGMCNEAYQIGQTSLPPDLITTLFTEDQRLNFYQRQRDFDGYVALLKTREKTVLQAEAKQLRALGKYFEALVRYWVLEDWQMAGFMAVATQDFERAAVCFENGGDTYQQGRALGKAGHYKQALPLLFRSQRDIDTRYRVARRYMPHVDEPWLVEQAKSLFQEGFYVGASQLFRKLRMVIWQGACAAIMGKHKLALKLWNRCDDPEILDLIAKFCLEHPKTFQPIGRLILDSGKACFPSWLKGLVNDQHTPHIFLLLERYFAIVTDPKRALVFAERIRCRDDLMQNTHLLLRFYVYGQDYDAFIKRWYLTPETGRAKVVAWYRSRVRDDLTTEERALFNFITGDLETMRRTLQHVDSTSINTPLLAAAEPTAIQNAKRQAC